MANNETNNSDLAYADTLWKSADTLRRQVDASEYKHVVLGLLFLKYISDSFEARRAALDRLIAAHAASLGITLVTNNAADFRDYPGLKLENWI